MHCLICFRDITEATTWQNLWTVKEKNICDDCESKFEKVKGSTLCEKCMKPVSEEVNLCGDCYEWQERFQQDPLIQNVSIFTYNDYMKDVMACFKYRGDYELVHVFKEAIKDTFSEHFKHSFQLVPIPLSDERLSERGFNQAEALAQLIDLPIYNVLKRTHSEKQSKKSKLERLTSKNPFRANHPISGDVLIIDDIYTTGTTLRQAAQTLIDHGATTVSSLTLIRS
ncbi:ComF family protein [Aquisalibacillus elongatus]|uniref:Competence protein ComFC n=1 Tax=Aquisalibacillus elongatus TaxID=485577 RepID=A0A3N5C4K2_9BACI|nr:ComF family protein [Aquisalibacillus elongatus]RPF54352.1 competence protein ComFC [Aquisalibacillus elongatus]